MKDIRACKHCGIYPDAEECNHGFAVQCDLCSVGVLCGSRKDAVKEWNKRFGEDRSKITKEVARGVMVNEHR